MNKKNHTGHIWPKLGSACYAIRCMYHFSNIKTMQMIYYAYFHANMKYGIVFCGNSIDIKRVFPFPKSSQWTALSHFIWLFSKITTVLEHLELNIWIWNLQLLHLKLRLWSFEMWCGVLWYTSFLLTKLQQPSPSIWRLNLSIKYLKNLPQSVFICFWWSSNSYSLFQPTS